MLQDIIQLLRSDFAAGAFSAFGLFVSYQLWEYFDIPSSVELEKKATEQVRHAGDNGTLTIWGLDGLDDCSKENPLVVHDSSPFVLRVEYYLHLKKQPYIKKKSTALSESPRRQLPVANLWGTMLDDSGRILIHCQKQLSDTIDSNLTDLQRATGIMIRRLLFDSLYYVLLFENFVTKDGREEFIAHMKKDTPSIVVSLIGPMIIRGQINRLNGVGISKYPEKEIFEMGKDDLRALNTILGEHKFFLGMNEPTVFDTDVHAFTSAFFFDPRLKNVSWIRDIKSELVSLEKHAIRMRSILFGENTKED